MQRAVRWAGRYYPAAEKRLDFTCWHYVRSEHWTACGRIVPGEADLLALERDTAEKVDCRQCLSRHEVRDSVEG